MKHRRCTITRALAAHCVDCDAPLGGFDEAAHIFGDIWCCASCCVACNAVPATKRDTRREAIEVHT